MMNIVVIESSPHLRGSSNLLAGEFVKGAQEAGHTVTIFDAARANLHPCLGCDVCRVSGPCCQKDDMEGLRDHILKSDMMVFVTPLYYFGMSAQLKTVLDRFYSFNGELASAHLKTAILVAAWDNNPWTMKAVQSHYEALCQYLNFQDQGQILGTGCGTVSMTIRTKFPQRAYELGRSL